jgi:hypothetical protein
MPTPSTFRTSRPSRPRTAFQRTACLVLLALAMLLIGTGVGLLVRPDSVSLSFSTATRGSGVSATQTRTVPPFAGIDLTGLSTVNVRVGGQQAVVVHADDNLIQRVTTEVRDGRLVIAEHGSFSTRSPLRVDVTVPSLGSAALSGSGHVNVAGVRSDQFTASETGSGVLTISGAVEQLTASLSGSGSVLLGALTARDVTATLAGSGRLEVHANRILDASIPGSGQIVYGGHPTALNRDVSGSGAILAR